MKVLPWLISLALIILIAIYLLGKFTEARTDQFYARAHLVEAKSEAQTAYINSMMPILYMTTIVVVVAGATVIVIGLIVGGGLGLVATLRYFEVRERLGAPVTLVQISSGGEQQRAGVYQLPANSRLIDVTDARRR